MKRFYFCLILLLLASPCFAATYYVSLTGNNSNPGTESLPWRTIAKAATVAIGGDTVIIEDGNYGELVQDDSHGSDGAFITYQARNKHKAILQSFRISGSYQKLDGLRFSGYCSTNNWAAAVRVETDGNFSEVRNCLVNGYPYVLAHDVYFDASTSSVISPSSNFIAAGFVAGGKVYLGASGATVGGTVVGDQVVGGIPMYYANHDTTWTIVSVAENSMVLSNGSNGAMIPDAGRDYWAFIRAGNGATGNTAFLVVQAGGVGAPDLKFIGNTVEYWPGTAFSIYGHNTIVERNLCENLLSYRFCDYKADNLIFRRNIVRTCKNVLYYSEADFNSLIHPPSTGWYDYQVGMFSGFITTPTGSSNNVLVEQNWFEDVENQLGRIDSFNVGNSGVAENVTFASNTFVGVSAHFSGGRPGMKWRNNTFHKCVGWIGEGGAANPLQLGAREEDVPQTGYEIAYNIFSACGPPGLPGTLTSGAYGVAAWVISPTVDYNFITSEEVTGFVAKTSFPEVNGINGGDPLFYDPEDADGLDNIPWTADDGLRVLPNSPAALLGIGSLGVRPMIPSTPIAHFRISAPLGWFEPEVEAYDPTWLPTLPTRRTNPARPWRNPVIIGTAPVAASFDASSSISGVSGQTTNTDIISYAWDFGDGATFTGTAPAVNHTFTSGGDKVVTLTTTNSVGISHTNRRTYRVLGTVVGQTPPGAPVNVRLRD